MFVIKPFSSERGGVTIVGMGEGGFSLWRWPDGWLWRWALAAARRLRQRRFDDFIRLFRPDDGTRVLDVGVTADAAGASNFMEARYAWAGSLTACGLEAEPEICRRRGIRFVRADGCELPFADGEFDVAHSNAVIEHVGSGVRQGRFVAELCRVGRAVWVATPDADGPLEPHTLLPLVHWFARPIRQWVYRAVGRGFFAEEKNLNPLTAGELRRLFPQPLRNSVVIRKQYIMGLPAILIATLER